MINWKEIIEYLENNIDNLYFGVECTCQYGDSYINKGETYKFVMWKGITITEYNVLSIRLDKNPIQKKVLDEIFNLLEVEFFHIGSDEFDEVREFYHIKGIKKDFLIEILHKIQIAKIIPREKYIWEVYSSKETPFDVFDWLELADPENGLDIDREFYQVKYSDLE